MTKDQERHLERLNNVFAYLNEIKYTGGTVEHDGNLWELDILPFLYNIRDEAIDQFNYVQSAIDTLEGKFPT